MGLRRASVVMAVVVALVTGEAAVAAAEGGAARAAPVCRPTAAPAVVGVDGTSATVTVPKCSSPTGVTGYRVQALNRAGTSVVRTADVSAAHGQAVLTGLTQGTPYRFRAMARNADGTGPASTLSAVTVQPFRTLAAFTDRQHRDLVGRAPTSAEASSWRARISDGSLSPVAVIDGLSQGSYWERQSPVVRLYQAYFLRLPDQDGLEYWVGRSRAGMSLPAMSQAFAGSAEFRSRYGSLTNRQFVQRIYQNVLGRPGDASGVSFWTSELDSGRRSRGQVMVGFSESSEYRSKTAGLVAVVNLFTGMVRRMPTSAEVTRWRASTRAQIITFLLASQAYAGRTRVVAPPAPGPLTGVRHLDIDDHNTSGNSSQAVCAVLDSGRVMCWGAQHHAGTELRAYSRATPIPGITDATMVAIANGVRCALLTTGRVRCWGVAGWGLSLGVASDPPSASAPGLDIGLSGVTSIAGGQSNICVTRTDGSAWCWGEGENGSVHPTLGGSKVPVAVPGVTGATAISVARESTCVRRSNGQVVCWGWKAPGSDLRAATIPGLSGVAEVSIGHTYECARLGNGQVRAAFAGLQPANVPGISTARSAACTGSYFDEHGCAALTNGTVRCWGDNDWGQLGREGSWSTTPTQVAGIAGATLVAVGGDTSCAVVTSGEVRCWGYNHVGQLGNGTVGVHRFSPSTVVTG